MPKSVAQILLLLLIASAVSMPVSAQEIVKTQRLLTYANRTVDRIRLFLLTCERQSPESLSTNTALRTANDEIREIGGELATVERELLRHVEAGFVNLEPCNATWQVALRHKGFLPTVPKDLEIASDAGTAIIKKTGNPPSLPGSSSPTYPVCPTARLQPGDRALFRFLIPSTPSRGGTPVPYFGLRDANGKEFVLGHLSDDGKEHEIRVQCQGTDSFAFFDGKLTRSYSPNNLESPLFVFFHMNDTSRLDIHEIRLSLVLDTNKKQ